MTNKKALKTKVKIAKKKSKNAYKSLKKASKNRVKSQRGKLIVSSLGNNPDLY